MDHPLKFLTLDEALAAHGIHANAPDHYEMMQMWDSHGHSLGKMTRDDAWAYVGWLNGRPKPVNDNGR